MWWPEGAARPVVMALGQDGPVFSLTGSPPLALCGGQPSQPTHLLV